MTAESSIDAARWSKSVELNKSEKSAKKKSWKKINEKKKKKKIEATKSDKVKLCKYRRKSCR